jgi:hypothetical protein
MPSGVDQAPVRAGAVLAKPLQADGSGTAKAFAFAD